MISYLVRILSYSGADADCDFISVPKIVSKE